MKKRKIEIRSFDISEYPKSKKNCHKAVVSESFEFVHGIRYLQRVYEDGAGELTRFDEETEMWAILVFPPKTDQEVVANIRAVIRNNFDVSVCLNRNESDVKAA